MQLVTYNIQYGLGRDGRYDLDRIADTVDGADVIALQEVERYWPRSGMVDQVKLISKRLPEYWWTYGANLDLFSTAGFPGDASNRRRQFGNLILSRSPILASRNIALPRVAGEPQTMQRGALEVVVDSPAGPAVRVYSTHLCYRSAAVRRAQVDTIFSEHQRSIDEGGPWAGEHPASNGWMAEADPVMPRSAIVLGDMNFAVGDDEHRAVFQNGSVAFTDTWTLLRGDDATPTHNAGHIDHAWVTNDLARSVLATRVDTDADGSDHQPVWLTVDI